MEIGKFSFHIQFWLHLHENTSNLIWNPIWMSQWEFRTNQFKSFWPQIYWRLLPLQQLRIECNVTVGKEAGLNFFLKSKISSTLKGASLSELATWYLALSMLVLLCFNHHCFLFTTKWISVFLFNFKFFGFHWFFSFCTWKMCIRFFFFVPNPYPKMEEGLEVGVGWYNISYIYL